MSNRLLFANTGNMRVSLLVGGMLYEGWTSVDVTRSVSQMSGQFTLVVSERWTAGQGGPSSLLQWRIRPGDACTLLYDGIPVITGYVDAYNPRYGAKQHEVTIQGRSKTGDLCDCSAEHPGGEMKKVKLDQIARTLTARYKLGVKVDGDTGAPFDDYRVEQGETVHESIERYARSRAMLATDDAEGNLVLKQVQYTAPVATLTEGINILDATAQLRSDKRHSNIRTKGQRAGTDQVYGKQAAQITAEADDEGVVRYRPLVVVPEGATTKQTARDRADWEGARRAGESVKAEVSVVGWTYAPGQLWTPGDMVMLISPMLAIERPLAIQTASMKQDKSGTVTRLALVPPEALNPKARKGKGGKNDSLWRNTRPFRRAR